MRTRMTPLFVVAALVLAACGGSGADTTTTAAETTTTTAAPAAGVEVATTSLGDVLVGPNGHTLYGFTIDDPGVSNCYDDCQAAWPPLPGDTPIGEGLDASLFTTTERTDGTAQLVIGEHPLYYFSGDVAPGDVNGQGLNDVWFVVTADGELVGMPAEETTETTEAAAAGGIGVADTDLGPTLVDADGMTLYGFLNDTPTTSACTGGCADNWPPVPGDAEIGADLDASLFSTITRDDGSTQLVLGDWPLYRFGGDTAPGDVNGQGIGEVWYVITPDGTLYR